MIQRMAILLALSMLVSVAAAGDASQSMVLAQGAGADAPMQAQLAVGHDGRVSVAYGVGHEVRVMQSVDGGATFAATKGRIGCPNMSLGMRRGPRIVHSGTTLVVTAIGGKLGKGKDGDVLAWQSSDQGATWSDPVRVNDTADSAREGLHAMTAAPGGRVFCTWLDLRNKRTEIFLSHSDDAGATWSANRLVYQSPGGSVCECCHPSVVAFGETVAVMFRNSLAGNRDMYLSLSTDGGLSFSAAKKLGTGSWPLDACPMDGGMLAIAADGSITTIWRRDREIIATGGAEPSEAMLGSGEQPWIAASGDGMLSAWTSGRDGELMVYQHTDAPPRKVSNGARNPVVVAGSNAGEFFVCWESGTARESAIQFLAVRK